jgi:pimeloyl-ACP methyl ester carboxylesterase
MTTPTRRPTLRRRLRRARRRLVGGVGLAWLRLTFVVLQAVSPTAADRKALDVWCTLPPGARNRHDHRPYRGGVVRLPVPSGGRIAAEVWGGGPVVYLMHGWGGWRGQLGAFVGPLVAAGHRVVSVDAPGHGDADPGAMGPRRGSAMEMIEALRAAGEAFGPAAAVVAHSLGCTVAGQVVGSSLTAERLVLIAPASGFGELVDHFAEMLRLNGRTRRGLQEAIERHMKRSIDGFDLAPLGADGGMPDTLVLHDRDDSYAPYRTGGAIVATWPNARLITTEGLGHYRILYAPATVEAAVEHITGRVPAEETA